VKRNLPIVLTVCWCCCSLLLAGDALALAHKKVAREALRWSGPLAAAQTLHLRGVNGAIKVEAATGTTVEIVVVERKRDNDRNQITVKVQPVKDGLMVCALYPGHGARCDQDGTYRSDDGGDVDLDAEFTVKLPAGVRVDAAAVNGNVTVHGATDRVVAKSVNGSLVVESSGGPVVADTVSGNVQVRSGTGAVIGKTVTGDLVVALPANLDAEVQAHAVHGQINNDFGLSPKNDSAGSKLRDTLGKGTYKVVLSTVNGDLTLRKQ
jgi:hypothetical protein